MKHVTAIEQNRTEPYYEICRLLRFKYVRAAMKQTLKSKENPRSAPMQIQYQ